MDVADERHKSHQRLPGLLNSKFVGLLNGVRELVSGICQPDDLSSALLPP